jgi:hypothetical protein
LNSTAGQKSWGDIKIWPNGVQANREKASAFPAKNNHFRLSVQDCALLQGFPEDWHFAGAVYQVLGQIGNFSGSSRCLSNCESRGSCIVQMNYRRTTNYFLVVAVVVG